MTKNPVINFSHHYPKLHAQERARLIRVVISDVKALPRSFVHYDTVYLDRDGLFPQTEKYYALPESGNVLILYFVGNQLIPFSTVRRWTAEKERWYTGMINMIFEVAVG